MNMLLPYAGQVLLLAVLLTLMTGSLTKNSRLRLPAVAVLLAAGLFVPVYGLSLAQWLRSVVGDLSVLTLLLFAEILARRLFGRKLLEASARNSLMQGIAALGLVFYPLALGAGSFDPYRLGYSPVLLPALLCLVSVIAWQKGRREIAIILLLPLIAFNLHLLESFNLFDYLLDPVVVVYACVQIVAGSKLLQDIKRVKG